MLRSDDPPAQRTVLRTRDLAGRRWCRLPDGTDPLWRAFWGAPSGCLPDGPVVRTVHECLRAVLWDDIIGLTPLVHALPDGLTSVPLADAPPSRLIVAWKRDDVGPLTRSLRRIIADVYGSTGS